MPGGTCRICQRDFKQLRFKTADIGICGRCTHYLNENPEPAAAAQARIAEMLGRGIQRRAYADLESDEEWKRRRAAQRLDDMDSAVEDALPGWMNRLLADPDNRNKNFKMMRAYRRGMLRMNGPVHWSYPSNWKAVARAARERDGRACKRCGASGIPLDVHHIVYLSRYGTNQKSNLVTLCRSCHEREHGREFDFGEEHDPESPFPIRPPPGVVRPADFPSPPTPVSPPPQPPSPLQPEPAPSVAPIDLTCPGCNAKLTAALKTPRLADHRVRCPVCERVFTASEGLESRLMPTKSEAASTPPSPIAPRPATDDPARQPPPPPNQKSSTFLTEDIAFFGVVAVLILLVLALAT